MAENIYLGRELRQGPRIDWAAPERAKVVELLDLLGLARRSEHDAGSASSPSPSSSRSRSPRPLAGDARVLILDEPRAILTDPRSTCCSTVVRRLRESGVGIIYISHRLDELFRIADEVTVMRDGETIGTHPIEEVTVRQIAELMVGRRPRRDHRAGARVPPTSSRRLEVGRARPPRRVP